MLSIRGLFTVAKPLVSRSFVTIHFYTPKGETKTVKAEPGENILRVAQHNGIPLEGACEGGMACATCHVILSKEYYDKLPEPSEAEEDCLDNAAGLTETSRLACQLRVTEDMDNMDVTIPTNTRNFYVDGHVPKPH
ncbi:2Fe-2S ferredoxin [Blastocystis sp. ATCC 50177/Nand II]|uniref:2Fe-2S ferredoxin n=1 Tax=Blastocystis sp. subtype 1 (strain ATCC 50177 / NandII) TaxID=478820 RepID=A0A196SFH7_BLAHN|nr:2Fe-2S ferredoxin [Blastocystis sp. ATCC 50177/Nand II]